ncbi:MAG: hypothetical protein H0T09_01250 [Actinobacteria bacterium]|nr:hypothetical protein [Actinomycetota bacterium]
MAILACGCAAAPVAARPLYQPERAQVLDGIEVRRVPPEFRGQTNPVDVALRIMRGVSRYEIVSMTLYRYGVDLCRGHPRIQCGGSWPVWLVRVRGSIRVSRIGGVATFPSAYFLVRDSSSQTVGFGAPWPGV